MSCPAYLGKSGSDGGVLCTRCVAATPCTPHGRIALALARYTGGSCAFLSARRILVVLRPSTIATHRCMLAHLCVRHSPLPTRCGDHLNALPWLTHLHVCDVHLHSCRGCSFRLAMRRGIGVSLLCDHQGHRSLDGPRRTHTKSPHWGRAGGGPTQR